MGKIESFVKIVLLGALSLGACVEAPDDETATKSDDPFGTLFEGCRKCQNGFANPVPTAGENDLQAAFNYVHGDAPSCSQAPADDEERADACSAWGAVVINASGGYQLWTSKFTNVQNGSAASCEEGTIAAYYTRWDATAGQCEYEFPSATVPSAGSGGDWYVKCVELLAPLETEHDYECS